MQLILISDRFCLRDRPGSTGRGEDDLIYARTPGLADGLGSVLNRIAGMATGPECVILLDQGGLGALGFPMQPYADEDTSDHAVLVDASVAGWTTPAALKAWMTFYAKGRPTLHVGAIPWMDAVSGAINGTTFGADIAYHHLQWLRHFGTAWHHTPGVGAIAALRGQQWPHAGTPTWKPENPLPVPAWELAETAWNAGQWRSPIGDLVPPEMVGTVEFDRRRAGLAAIVNAEVSPFTLRNYPRTKFDPTKAGFWLIDSDPKGWNDPLMPDPRGYGIHAGRHERWMTTPRVRLLAELAEAGKFGNFEVKDAWIGDGHRTFRKWGERIRDAYTEFGDLPHDTDRALMQQLVKDGYRQGPAMFTLPNASITRPDWYACLTATQAVTVWRSAWGVYQASKGAISPLHFNGDAITYLDPEGRGAGLIPSFDQADRLGGWRVKATPAVVAA